MATEEEGHKGMQAKGVEMFSASRVFASSVVRSMFCATGPLMPSTITANRASCISHGTAYNGAFGALFNSCSSMAYSKFCSPAIFWPTADQAMMRNTAAGSNINSIAAGMYADPQTKDSYASENNSIVDVIISFWAIVAILLAMQVWLDRKYRHRSDADEEKKTSDDGSS